MKKYYYFLFIAIIGLTITNLNANSANKKFLLEQFTGYWCGHCTDGVVRMDELISANQDKVIGIRFHSGHGDKMEIPETNEIYSYCGNLGYPSGAINRKLITGYSSINLSRGDWANAYSKISSETAIVDIKVDWTYDKVSNTIIANITGTFEQALNQEARFNIFITEDDVTGTGSGWDQSNYSNTTVGHPYYGKGNPIVGYHHMKVARACLGGSFGQPNSIPLPISAGQKVKYSFSIAKAANWNLDNIKLIGLVQLYTTNSKEILNVVEGTKVETSTSISHTGELITAGNQQTSKELDITIKNSGSSAIEYAISLTKTPTTTWKAVISPNQQVVQIPAGGSYSLKLTMPIESIGVGEASVNIEEEDGMTFSRTLKVYSADVDYISILADNSGDMFATTNIKSYAEYKNMLTMPISDFNTLYNKFGQLKIAHFSLGEDGLFANEYTSMLNYLMVKKVNLLMHGPQLYGSLGQNQVSIQSQLGLYWLGMSFIGQNTQGKFNLIGVKDDPITNGFNSQIQIYYYIHKTQIVNPNLASPIITYEAKTDSIFGTKHNINGQKIVCFGFNPARITDQTLMKTTLYKAMKWLYEAPDPEYPEISAPTGIDFGAVETDTTKEKTFEITNVGKKDLVISDMKVSGNDAAVYEILDKATLPFTLTPNNKTTVNVKFAPTTIKFYTAAQINITSNDEQKPTFAVALAGKGAKPTSVVDISAVNPHISPMPVSDVSTIQFFVPDGINNVKLSIVDLLGNNLMDIDNNSTFGLNSIALNKGNLLNGTYILLIQLDNEVVQFKFNVVE